MKYLISAVSVLLTVLSCQKTETSPVPNPYTTENSTSTVAPAPQNSPAPAASAENEGKSLVEGADCLSCHKTDSRMVGPSFEEIASKYSGNDTSQLAQKIISGGQGVWGEVPMPPHAGLSTENAEKMVKYILSLKK